MGKSKYSLEFKRDCVEKVQIEGYTTSYIARVFGLDKATVNQWVQFYVKYGDKGLVRLKNRYYDAQFKLNVLQSIEKQGYTLLEASVKFNIANKSCILNWQRSYEKSGILGLSNQPRGKPKNMSDYKRKKRKTNKPLSKEEELLEQIEYLKAENAILKKLKALIQERKNTKPLKN